jgi:hypothetical protein
MRKEDEEMKEGWNNSPGTDSDEASKNNIKALSQPLNINNPYQDNAQAAKTDRDASYFTLASGQILTTAVLVASPMDDHTRTAAIALTGGLTTVVTHHVKDNYDEKIKEIRETEKREDQLYE